MSKVPAKHFVQMLAGNVDNNKLSHESFRAFVRNTLPIVEGGENYKTPKTKKDKEDGD